MNYYYGKTVDLAIEAGLAELGISKEDAIIKVIEEGTKGFLGLGGEKAKVSVESKKDSKNRVCEFLDGLFEVLKIPAQAEAVENGEKLNVNIITTSSATLIGYRGEMLDALQTVASAVANIGKDDYLRVVVDCENYREKREETLKNLALHLAQKAKRIERAVTLEPMNPFERRIIHAALTDVEGITTESQGVEPNRFVVITPDNAKPFVKKENKRGGRNNNQNKGGFKSEMLKTTKKTSGFGTYLGNSLKD